jgi:decaprenyl-phosphate phosphoribosyltransferase
VKNFLVFAVPLVARALTDTTVVIDTTLAFVAFCAASSGMYLVNDLRDRSTDVVHPRKSLRPIASGRLSSHDAEIAAALLVIVSVILAALVSLGTLGVVCAYLLSTTVYSAFLKRIPILELLVLASGFVLRALAGAFAAHIPPSKWFLLCVLFGSLFIAIKKRFAEMPVAANRSSTRHVLVWYTSAMLETTARFAGGIFILAYLGWSIAADHQTIQQYTLRIFSVVPFAIAVARYDRQASGESGESPEDLFASDRVLQLLGVTWFALVSASIYLAR